jgi:hypothetical protein
MATVRMAQAGDLPGSRRKRLRGRVFMVAALAALAALVWFWRPMTASAVAGVSYGARVACSCRYIAGRDLEDCEKDFLPGMGLVVLSEDDAEKSVTARVFPLASETVRYRKGEGCVFDPAP